MHSRVPSIDVTVYDVDVDTLVDVVQYIRNLAALSDISVSGSRSASLPDTCCTWLGSMSRSSLLPTILTGV